MKIAYLMNTYPMVSTTFIGREIAALTRAGFDVSRYVIRRWDGTLVDPLDIAESEASDHLLEDGAAKLITGLLRELIKNPGGVMAALRLWGPLWMAGGGFIRHVAYFLEACALRQRLRDNPVVHIHAHFSTNAATVAMLTRAMGGPPYSFTVHGPDELFNPIGESLGTKAENAAFVACISHFCRSQVMIFAPVSCWNRLKIVHCGVEPAQFLDAPAADLPPKPAGGRILYVARLSQLKGGLVLMEALPDVLAAHPDADVVVIGDGEARPWMEQKAQEQGLTDKVHFLGFQPRDVVRAAMADADVFTLPSFAEGVPVVLMEALASKTPVVATQVAGVSELVQDGLSGYITPPGDAVTLADRLSTLLSDPDLRQKMGETGRIRVETEFDIDGEALWLGQLITASGNGADLPPALRPEDCAPQPNAA